jgi:hypothetical protein
LGPIEEVVVVVSGAPIRRRSRTAATWQHVLTDPSPVIADEFLLNNGGPTSETPEVGDTITVVDPTSGATRSLTIAALSTDDYLTRRAPTEDRSSAPDEVAFDPGDRRSNAGSWGHERTAVA